MLPVNNASESSKNLAINATWTVVVNLVMPVTASMWGSDDSGGPASKKVESWIYGFIPTGTEML